MRASDIGKSIIQWGDGQTPRAVAETRARTRQITPEVVADMRRQGLQKSWIEAQVNIYQEALLIDGKRHNTQLKPRLELMECILSYWND